MKTYGGKARLKQYENATRCFDYCSNQPPTKQQKYSCLLPISKSFNKDEQGPWNTAKEEKKDL